ncbi:Cationic trypsin [Collichthys lucidus]|uniref:Cationic trypsin n=1 Tax=Collichthys lucidus TaxID=240159 RepID=A0A4U5U431_COLLU|nr:Cationic trypsin [Collichthys lucidus]
MCGALQPVGSVDKTLSGFSSFRCCGTKAVIRRRTAALACVMLFFLMWVGVTVRAAVDLQKRIIGGEPCERPYHVKLRAVAARGSHKLCGGSLISDKWILTAAHCFETGRTMYASVNAAQEVKITANPVIYKDDNNRPHDIMLLQLPNSTDIQPVALPDSLDSKPCLKIGKTIQIAGQGATKGGPNNKRGFLRSSKNVPTEYNPCSKYPLELDITSTRPAYTTEKAQSNRIDIAVLKFCPLAKQSETDDDVADGRNAVIYQSYRSPSTRCSFIQ